MRYIHETKYISLISLLRDNPKNEVIVKNHMHMQFDVFWPKLKVLNLDNVCLKK